MEFIIYFDADFYGGEYEIYTRQHNFVISLALLEMIYMHFES